MIFFFRGFWWQHLSRVSRHWLLQSQIIIQESDWFRRHTKNPQLWEVAYLSPIRGSKKCLFPSWPCRDGITPGVEEERSWKSNVLMVNFWENILHESYIWNGTVTRLISALWLEVKWKMEFTWIFLRHPEVMRLLTFHGELEWENCC